MGGGPDEYDGQDQDLVAESEPESQENQPSAATLISEIMALVQEAKEAESCGFTEIASEKYSFAGHELIKQSLELRDPDAISALNMQASECLTSSTRLRQQLQQQQRNVQQAQPIHCLDVEFSPHEIKNGAQVMGLGLGAGMGGLIGFPILGGITGLASASLLVEQETEAGAKCRNLGVVGAKAIRKVQHYDHQLHVSETVKRTFDKVSQTTMNHLSSIDKRFKVSDRLKKL